MSVVHGTNRRPSSGTKNESNARSTRFVKIQRNPSAIRAEIIIKSRKRQGTTQRLYIPVLPRAS